jgi:hypothetical protein
VSFARFLSVSTFSDPKSDMYPWTGREIEFKLGSSMTEISWVHRSFKIDEFPYGRHKLRLLGRAEWVWTLEVGI